MCLAEYIEEYKADIMAVPESRDNGSRAHQIIQIFWDFFHIKMMLRTS